MMTIQASAVATILEARVITVLAVRVIAKTMVVHISVTRMNRIGVIVQAVIRLAGKVFAQGRMYLKSGFMEPEASRTELTAAESLNVSTHVVGDDGDVKNTSTAEAGINGGGGDGGACTREDKMEAHTTAGYDKPFQFPQFEIVHQSPSDHHYLDNVKQVRNFLFSDQLVKRMHKCG